MKTTPLGPTSFVPGDIMFSAYKIEYPRKRGGYATYIEPKAYLIVSTFRGPRGKFMSTRNNNLICCYEIKETLPTLLTVIDNLYNNNLRCSYYGGLDAVFGTKAFRTFIIRNLVGPQEIYIFDDDEELEDIQEELEQEDDSEYEEYEEPKDFEDY